MDISQILLTDDIISKLTTPDRAVQDSNLHSELLTEGIGTLSGKGAFDELMKAVDEHLTREYKAQRITGSMYSTLYAQALTAAMQTAAQYAIQGSSAYWQSKIAEASYRKAEAEILKALADIEYARLQTEIAKKDLELKEKELTLKAKGGISFKSKRLNADLFANATTSKTTINYMKYEPTTTRTNTIGVLGKVETKNFDISTVVSAMSVNETGFEDWEKADNKTSVTASIIIGIKNLFGKNVMPILKYNVGNYDGAAQNLGAGVIITP